MTPDTHRPTPVASPDRWERAFERAARHGIAPRRVGFAADRWAVASASRRPVRYLVTAGPDGLTCTCPAGDAGDPICFHRAAVLMAVSSESRREDAPPPAA